MEREGPRVPRRGPAGRLREVGCGVRVRVEANALTLQFLGRFSPLDLEVVKKIRGRKWQPEQWEWVLPRSTTTLDTLSLAFGPRLTVVHREGVDPLTPAGSETGGRARSPDAIPEPAPSPGSALPHHREGGEEPTFTSDGILAELRRGVRLREYSPSTERAYLGWVRRFLGFAGARGVAPQELNAGLATDFFEHLASEAGLSAGSRNQAASAVGFMFREVLGRDELAEVPRAKGPKRAPMVLTHREVLRIFRELHGKHFLIGVLLYSAGLRLEECLRLRVKDVDFELRQLLVRDGKGRKDRHVPLAERAAGLVRMQIRRVGHLHAQDCQEGKGWAPLPGALHRKFPGAGYELGWQFLFPAGRTHTDPTTGKGGRWPLHPTAVQRQVKAAVRRSGVTKPATCHTFRHSFATEALRGGCDIRTLQHVMGHKDVRTTMIYLHVVEQTGHLIRSPLDRPDDPHPDADSLYDPDLVERPWGNAPVWELGARQWGGRSTGKGKPRGPSRGGRAGEGEGEGGEGEDRE